ncbi:MAG: phosphoribosylformylglycinamidine synthase subunit PurL [Bdellovibrionales bacterium]|nr:phosphoribosylformylglycinamidine synthase subunit PurL [Bdellovibrionales bacterium]
MDANFETENGVLNSQLKQYRLSLAEYEKIVQVLGRAPKGVEWALFSALWSEHCSYKSSRLHLRKFKYRNDQVLQSMGENAGVIDLGKGERIAFKMESHNHPSFIEPYQGAATGVGGILRDIFTMGARPIALANYLCFGDEKSAKQISLVDGVVRGISGYGNCVGVPTVTGQVEFHSSYKQNILVNALALGLFRPNDPILTSQAKGVGNWVVYVGAKTGRDGIHGASMASEAFGDNAQSKKPTIQIGDPFYEKLLIESCLEVMAQGLVVSIQDMGAAGLTSSCFEMAAKGGVGIKLELDRVPLRDRTLTPEDILLSESQERMLLICEPHRFAKLKGVFERWGLDAVVIGEVVSGRDVDLWWRGESICKIDPRPLVDGAPVYDRSYEPWRVKSRVAQAKLTVLPETDPEKILLNLLQSPLGGSRKWVYRQYDQRVGAKTVRDASESVAVLRLPDSGRALGLVLGCRPHLMRFDAAEGGKDALLYPALELAAKGFQPLAATDCLNFGNPEKKEIMSEFVATVDNLAQTAEVLETPIISGNVSFYNETQGKNITSTPATGVVGLREQVNGIPLSVFSRAGDEVLLLRAPMLLISGLRAEPNAQNTLAATESSILGYGTLSLKRARGLIDCVRQLTQDDLVTASRVVGKFGLAYALARMSLGGIGARVRVGEDRTLFGEWLYEVVLAVPAAMLNRVQATIRSRAEDDLLLEHLGSTGGVDLEIMGRLRLPIKSLRQNYEAVNLHGPTRE